MKPKEEATHRKLEEELGHPVGLICLIDEVCLLVCSFCNSFKEFNELLSLKSHIKNVHGSREDSVIDTAEKLIDGNNPNSQGITLNSGIDKILINRDGFLYEISSKSFDGNEISISLSKNTLLEHNERNPTKSFPEQNLFIKSKMSDQNYKAAEIQSQEFNCTKCNQNFQFKNELVEHICSCKASNSKTSVPKRKRSKQDLQCKICFVTLTSRRNLATHLRRHTGEKPHKCDHCPKSFYTKSALKNHLVTHTGDRNYKCEYCVRTFGTSWYLWRHRKRSHPEHPNKRSGQMEASKIIQDQNNINDEHLNHHSEQKANAFLCNQCATDFQSEDELCKHICIKNDPFQCTFCAASFISQVDLGKHMQTHTAEKPYKCELCSLAFYKEDLLTKHMTKHNMKRYKCEYENCDRSYSSIRTLRFHYKIHSGNKPYNCELCPLSFYTSTLLKIHMVKHTGERYKCDYEDCNRSYSSVDSLRSHKRKHNDDRHYKCEFCSLTFPHRVGLTDHMVKHTGDRYKCEYAGCHRSYSTMSGVYRHMRKHIEIERGISSLNKKTGLT